MAACEVAALVPPLAIGMVVVVPSTPPAVLVTTPAVARSENVTVPEDVTPVAAAIAPEPFTWNWLEEPTLNSEFGAVVPMPTLPPANIAA